MEIPLSILLLIIGYYISFLSANLTSISQDAINRIIEKNYKSAQRIQNLQQDFNEDINPFLIFELIFYLSSALLFGIYLSQIINEPLQIAIIIAAFSVSNVIIRFIIQALGIKYANRINSPNTFLLWQIHILGSPLSKLSEFMIKRIAGEAAEEDSREEISALMEYAREDGSIEDGEYKRIRNILDLNEIYVADVMTPRTVIFSLEAEKTVGQVATLPELQMYSRIPIWEGESIDDGVIGYIMAKDIIIAALNGRMNAKLRDFAHEVYLIPDTSELDTVLEKFLQRRQHMFIAVDRFGGIEGVITMEDVLEAVLGEEIVDEADRFVDMRQLAKLRRDRRIKQLAEK